MRILIVEDEPKTGDYLQQGLVEAGFSVDLLRDGKDGLHHALTESIDLVILDVMLPGLDGWGILSAIRRAGKDMPVLFLTARDAVDDRVKGLELGADDYMVKPFDARELVARVRSILRRYERSEKPGGRRIANFEGWRFDPASFGLRSPSGEEEFLGTAEARLLQLLLERPNRILTREQLAGIDDLSPMDRSIDVRVSRLRKRLGDDPHEPKMIKTVYGAGYLMAAVVRWEG